MQGNGEPSHTFGMVELLVTNKFTTGNKIDLRCPERSVYTNGNQTGGTRLASLVNDKPLDKQL